MIEHADALIAYRTYPHVDMAETGRAAARHLALLLKTKQKFAKAFRKLPFLIAISWQCTNDQPTRDIYQKLAALESDAVPTLSFAPGFPAATIPARHPLPTCRRRSHTATARPQRRLRKQRQFRPR